MAFPTAAAKPGFLLIEILIAILLLALFASITGFYWQGIHAQRSLARRKLRALSIACDVADSFIWTKAKNVSNSIDTYSIEIITISDFVIPEIQTTKELRLVKIRVEEKTIDSAAVELYAIVDKTDG
jgi:type II secretory pathway pseudopilin PulG